MEKEILFKDLEQQLGKYNYNADRINENLYVIEKEIKSYMSYIKNSSFAESSGYLNQLEELKLLISKVFYNRYKIEISDFLFHFMTEFERIDTESEKKRLWKLISSNEYKF